MLLGPEGKTTQHLWTLNSRMLCADEEGQSATKQKTSCVCATCLPAQLRAYFARRHAHSPVSVSAEGQRERERERERERAVLWWLGHIRVRAHLVSWFFSRASVEYDKSLAMQMTRRGDEMFGEFIDNPLVGKTLL